MEMVVIEGQQMPVRIYDGQRVVTLKDIDTVHQRPEGTARKRFNDNKRHFVIGEDYYKICPSEIRTHNIMEVSPKAREDITLLTETGYLMIVKSFNDDLAWNVQRQLVNSYFRAKEILQSEQKPLAPQNDFLLYAYRSTE